MGKSEIIVNSWSRSGTTWLIHLLSDLLASPQQDLPNGKIIGCWGPHCNGNYVIRKRHAKYHSRYRGKTVVLIHRDVCGIVVSTAFYLNISFNEAIGMMSGYNNWLKSWLKHATVITRYEDLNDYQELKRITYQLTGLKVSTAKVRAAMRRQNFENMTRQLNDTHFMRRGMVGDWRNYLSKKQVKQLYDLLD